MIIEIEDKLYNKVLNIVKSRNITIYNELKEIKPYIPINTLETARDIKTQRVKQSIKETIKELIIQDITPSKYQINKSRKIAYATLNKYYNDILKEVNNV